MQASNVGFTSEVSDFLVVHTGPDPAVLSPVQRRWEPILAPESYTAEEATGFPGTA